MELFSQLRLSDTRSIKLNDLEAFSTFYQLLCNAKEPVQLLIPETVVWGWGVETPSLLFTNDEGSLQVVENINSEHLQNFLLVCRKHQNDGAILSPACVARTANGTSLIFDTKDAMCLWHRNQIEGHPVMLQRFIISDSVYTRVTRLHWTHLKTEKTQLESRFLLRDEAKKVNMLAHLKSSALVFKSVNTVLKRSSVGIMASDDPKYLVKFKTAKKTYDNSKVPELDAQLNVLFHIIKQHEKKLEASLLELIANFVKGQNDLWYLINLEHLLFSKHTQMQLKNPKAKPKTSVPSRYRAKLVKSRTVELIKPNPPRRTSSRKLSGTPLSQQKKTSLSPSSTSSNKGETISHIKLQEMPPLFAFPTPRLRPHCSETFLTVPKHEGFTEFTMSSTLPLMSYNYKERLQKIRDHIDKQNNSLYARIHYCDELPSTKLRRDVIGKSISRVATRCDKVRARAKLLSQTFN